MGRRLTRSTLVKLVAKQHSLSRGVASLVVDDVLSGITDGLCAGKRVELRGLGTLRPRHYAGYPGRNPRTGERVWVSRKVLPVFRPGRSLLDRLNQTIPRED